MIQLSVRQRSAGVQKYGCQADARRIQLRRGGTLRLAQHCSKQPQHQVRDTPGEQQLGNAHAVLKPAPAAVPAAAEKQH